MPKCIARFDVISMLCQENDIEKEEASALLEAVLSTITDCLASGKDVKIPRFGTFIVHDKAARPGRNPRTKEPALIEKRRVVTLRASKTLKFTEDSNAP
ncbi:MAG: integration host factor subunit alpha [Alphaproteobacteria bacterium]|nr:integration host factor subunit alpha [Alphaproteobacteria bacterium]